MINRSIAMVVCLLAACSASAEPNGQLMDMIERAVRLPPGAAPLHAYARYYAADQSGRVIGLFRIPAQRRARNEICEELALEADGEVTGREVPCGPEPPTNNNLAAGQRLWLTDFRQMPDVLDGGCSVVNVQFNPATAIVEAVSCNGEA